jgi:outer membrane immunogenic protein
MRPFSWAGMAAVCVVACSNQTLAADLGGRDGLKDGGFKPEQKPAIWQGLYVGATLGASSTIVNVDKAGNDRDLKGNRASFSGFAGYNFANGPWVWGVEADLARHGVDKKPVAVSGLGNLSGEHGLLGSARLRGGYAWNDVLFYGTAGIAFTNIAVKSSLGGKSEFSTGAVIGLGAEWAFDKAWTARIEGLAYGFGDTGTLAGTKRDVALGTSTLRLGVAHKF